MQFTSRGYQHIDCNLIQNCERLIIQRSIILPIDLKTYPAKKQKQKTTKLLIHLHAQKSVQNLAVKKQTNKKNKLAYSPLAKEYNSQNLWLQ